MEKPDLTPMTREEIDSVMDSLANLDKKVEALPYLDAVEALRAIQEVRDLIGEQLPGGYYGRCLHCEEVKGEDEMQDCGDERICAACVKRWEDDERNAAQASAAEDEFERHVQGQETA